MMKRFYKLRDLLVGYPDRFLEVTTARKVIIVLLSFILGGGIVTVMIFLRVYWGVNKKGAGITVAYRAERGGYVFREGVRSRPIVIHPLPLATSQLDKDLKYLLYKHLFRIRPDGALQLDLASGWQVSDKGKTITIFLSRGNVWSDGKPITANDVVFTFNFIKQHFSETPVGQLLKDARVLVRDLYTVQLTLDKPFPHVVYYLTFPIVAKHYYQRYVPDELLYEGLLIKPLTSGRFTIENISEGSIMLQDLEDGGSLGADYLEFVYEHDNSWEALLGKRIQALADVTLQEAERLVQIEGIRVHRFIKQFNFIGLFIKAENSNPVLRDVNFRRALYAAIDRGTIARGLGTEPAYSVYPKQSVYFNGEMVARLLQVDPNVLLGKVSRSEDKRCNVVSSKVCYVFTLVYPKDDDLQYIAHYLRESLGALGVVVELKEVSLEELVSSVLPLRDFEVLLLELETLVDPDQYGLWHSSQVEYPGKNIVGLQSKRLDRVLLRGRTLEGEERIKEYQTMQELLFEYMYFIPIVHSVYRYAYWEDSINISKDSRFLVSPEHRFEYITLESTGK